MPAARPISSCREVVGSRSFVRPPVVAERHCTRTTEFADLIPVLSGWRHNDLTRPPARSLARTGVPAGYMFDAQGTQHVVYRSADNHIRELWWDAGGWHHGDCRQLPALRPLPATPLVTCSTRRARSTLSTVAPTTTSTSCGGTTPAGTGATSQPQPARPAAAGNPAGYMFDAQPTQHVVYRGADNHIHELWWDNAGWHRNDLSAATSAPVPQATRPATSSTRRAPARHLPRHR